MKKFKNKLKEMHSTTLRFIIAMLGVYYLIQLIINGVLKDGLIFTAGLAYPGLLYDSWYNTEGQTSKKKEMIQDFILRLIPKHLSSQIGTAELSLGSSYNNVTMLFADIVGFTAYSADKTPKEVVRMLSKLFTSFDKECNKLQLYKVYTIGDCYVVMSFLDGNDRIEPEQECADVAELGFSMIEIIAKVRKEVNFDGLHMRIGIHTVRPPVTSGNHHRWYRGY
jgi:hypothetical protein